MTYEVVRLSLLEYFSCVHCVCCVLLAYFSCIIHSYTHWSFGGNVNV